MELGNFSRVGGIFRLFFNFFYYYYLKTKISLQEQPSISKSCVRMFRSLRLMRGKKMLELQFMY